jgi:hypothetical protein
MSPRLPRGQNEQRGLRLWPVGCALTLAFTTAILVAGAVFYTAWDLLGARELKPEHRIDSKTLFDLVKLSFGTVAGAGALVALVVAYRRQRVDEDGAQRDATRLHTERFTTAVSQLGDDSPAIRLGGVHALAGLADDAPTRKLRQTCIDVLCAYVQLPFTPDPGDDPEHQEEHNRYLAFRKVRHTILRLIGDHYQRPMRKPGSWQGYHLDLTGVTIDGDLDLKSATFSDGTVSFEGATFSGGTVSFEDATFSDGTVSFKGATFSGATVLFHDATFSDGTVSFKGATFSGATVLFHDATFSDGTVSFEDATFSGGTVSFKDATFYRPWSFGSTRYYGGRPPFGGFPTFSGARVVFEGASFSGGTVSFHDATGTPPIGLIPRDGSPLPTGLLLPQAWYRTSQ